MQPLADSQHNTNPHVISDKNADPSFPSQAEKNKTEAPNNEIWQSEDVQKEITLHVPEAGTSMANAEQNTSLAPTKVGGKHAISEMPPINKMKRTSLKSQEIRKIHSVAVRKTIPPTFDLRKPDGPQQEARTATGYTCPPTMSQDGGTRPAQPSALPTPPPQLTQPETQSQPMKANPNSTLLHLRRRNPDRAATRAHKGNAAGRVKQCLACRKETSIYLLGTGPDGRETLCPDCSTLYGDKALPLYRDDKTGQISVVSSAGATKLSIARFRMSGKRRDLLRPVLVRPLIDGVAPVQHDRIAPARGNYIVPFQNQVTASIRGDGFTKDRTDERKKLLTSPGKEAMKMVTSVPEGDNIRAAQNPRNAIGAEEKRDSKMTTALVFSIKIKCRDAPLRRYKIQEGLTFKEFEKDVQEKFRLSQNFEISYTDNEGDKAALSSEKEMEELFDIMRLTVATADKSFSPSACLTPLRIEVVPL